MLKLNVKNETSLSSSFGTALSNGETPSIAEAYDPKSLEHILAGTYPVERYGGGDGCFYEVLQKYNVNF
jgi:hypothetical protein